MPGVGEPVALYTDLLVREDLLQLFGFPTLLDKEWHRLLMTVQGVGAKASMAILGALGAEGVARAIALGDARAIQSAHGVGPKLAQRVILELKAKAPGVMAMGVALSATAEADDSVIEAPQPAVPQTPHPGRPDPRRLYRRRPLGAPEPRLRPGRCGPGRRHHCRRSARRRHHHPDPRQPETSGAAMMRPSPRSPFHTRSKYSTGVRGCETPAAA